MQYTLSFASVQFKKHLDLIKECKQYKKQAKKHPKRVQKVSKKSVLKSVLKGVQKASKKVSKKTLKSVNCILRYTSKRMICQILTLIPALKTTKRR